jgi:hypothetical protein
VKRADFLVDGRIFVPTPPEVGGSADTQCISKSEASPLTGS